jgi:hypothetical protein
MQAFLSVIAASDAEKGMPYVGIGPLPWWQSVLRSPWSLAVKFGAMAHPLATEILLFAAYTVTIFAVFHH